MKKCISLLLAVIFVLSCTLPAFAGSINGSVVTDEPVIIVPGYAASPLFFVNEDGSIGEQAWGWNIMTGKLLDQVRQRVPQLLAGVGALTLGEAKLLGKALGETIVALAGDLACDGNGKSIKNIAPLSNDAEVCRWDHIKENFGSDYYSEAAVGNEITDYIPKDQLYNFYMDFRCGAAENAARLDEFVQSVKAYTGAEKVNLYSLSHGGQVTATYLSLFGEKLDVDNALLTVPAIGGSPVAYDVLAEKMAINEETLLYFIENAVILDQNFNWLVRAHQLGFLDDVLAEMMPYVKQVVGGWQSLWDFLPYDCYQAVAAGTDQAENAGLIATTTDFHENIMANMGEALRTCRETYGIDVNIMAGAGSDIVTGSKVNSDAIISVNSATGAAVAPYGQRFVNGYTSSGTVCSAPAHRHVSPAMDIDAGCGYLPENTWYVEGFFHGMTMNESLTRDLALQLLLTDNITDIYSDPAFPQFLVSENHSYAVKAAFAGNASGYIDDNDNTLVVTNISKEKKIRIASITVGGADVQFSGNYTKYIAPGESLEFAMEGDLPNASDAKVTVDVAFMILGSAAPLNSRMFSFNLQNGVPAAYDTDAPYCDLRYTPVIYDTLPGGLIKVLKFFGLYDVFRMLFDIFRHLAARIKTAV